MATAPVVESSTLSRIPGSRVWIRPTVRALSVARRSIGPPSSAISTQRSTTARDAAKGITLTVATIWPASTRAWGATVPSVMASSRRLSRSTRASSITARPCASAKMLQRPVKASPRVSPGPQTARATVSAASSSPTSSGSRRAPETVSIFASSSTGDILGREHAPLLEGAAGQAHAVSEDQSLRLCDRHVAEDHGPPVTIRRPRPARAAGGAPESPRP